MKQAMLSAAMVLGLASAAMAGPPVLELANPPPKSVKSGLAVTYAYPIDVKTLNDARTALKKDGVAGRPLAGLDYPDTRDGDKVMTSDKAYVVAAQINGYMKFDAPGVYEIEVFSNDGLDLSLGGQRIAKLDERAPCGSAGRRRVEVKDAGWYKLSAVYFQRMGTSCLQMEMGKDGAKRKQVPNAVFGY